MRIGVRWVNVRLLATFVAGLLVASGPQIAIAAFDATNSDKVDGRHAVRASATSAQRAGKLVATNSSGQLPNNIIAKAPDTDRIDGLDSAALQRRVTGKCSSGTAVTGVRVAGSVTCATDRISGGDAQTLDGSDSTDFQGALTNTVVVGQVGTPTQNGAALLAALASIPQSGSNAPAANNPWLLKIEPGLYELTSPNRLEMREHVDVEGSGPGTVVTCACGSSSLSPSDRATVVTAPGVELRSLTVTTRGGGHTAVAIGGEGTATISDVVVNAGGGEVAAVGINLHGPGPNVVQRVRIDVSGSVLVIGIESQANGLLVTDSDISSFGTVSRGIQIDAVSGGIQWIRNTIATATTASENESPALRTQLAATYRVDGSSLTGSGVEGKSIRALTGSTVHVSATRLDGPTIGPGSFVCVGAFDAVYAPLSATCQ